MKERKKEREKKIMKSFCESNCVWVRERKCERERERFGVDV